MKFGTTKTSRVVSSAKKNRASRRLGSSFQNAHCTSAKIFRRLISAACASVGALESGFTVDPWPTIKSALSDFTEENVQQPALSASRMASTLNVQRSNQRAPLHRFPICRPDQSHAIGALIAEIQ